MGRLRANITWKTENMGQSHWHHGLVSVGYTDAPSNYWVLRVLMFCVSRFFKTWWWTTKKSGIPHFETKQKISGWWYVQKYGSESDWMPSCLLCLLGLPWPQLTTTDHNNCLNHMFWPNTLPCTILPYGDSGSDFWLMELWLGSWRKPHFRQRFDWRRCHQRLWVVDPT